LAIWKKVLLLSFQILSGLNGLCEKDMGGQFFLSLVNSIFYFEWINKLPHPIADATLIRLYGGKHIQALDIPSHSPPFHSESFDCTSFRIAHPFLIPIPFAQFQHFLLTPSSILLAILLGKKNSSPISSFHFLLRLLVQKSLKLSQIYR
jgi:hypothetical protein